MSNEELVIFLRKNVISVTCVVVSIAIGLALYFRSDLLPEAEHVLDEKTKEGELLAANIQDSAQLKEQQAEIVEANQAIALRMIRVGHLAENLQYFYELESLTGTKLTDLRQIPYNPPKNAPKTNFISIGFNLTAQGSYAQLIDLLRRLEAGAHYCRIITCTLKPMTEVRGGPIAMTVNLDLLGTQ